MTSIVLLAVLIAAPVLAQEANSQEAERTRIASLRARAEAEFAVQEKACYARFAVNACIDQARARRRSLLAELRRQEVDLNDAERRRRAAERVGELESRQLEQQRKAVQPSAPALPPGDGSRIQTQSASAPVAPTAAAPSAPASAPLGAQPASAPAARSAAPAATPRPRAEVDAAENARRHQQRLEQARQHKERVQKKAASNDKPSRALPVPP